MKRQYDWSNLDPEWTHSNGSLTHNGGPSLGGMRLSHVLVANAEAYAGGTYGEFSQFMLAAKEQLRKCRIPAPDMTDEYDWSRLEGSGWRHANEDECITDGTWTYWYTAENSERLQTSCVFAVEDAARAQERAADLVAKCKHDWRDEVKQACEGMNVRWNDDGPRPNAFVTWGTGVFVSKVRLHSDRTWRITVHTDAIEELLAISVVLERLKKRGWREA